MQISSSLALAALLLASGGALAHGQSSTASEASESRYDVRIDAPKKLGKGESGKLAISITPKNPGHMNLDFPTSLSLTPSGGVQIASTKLKKKDAKRLDENGAAFEIVITGTKAGSQKITGKLKFAVCQDDSCAPVSETVDIALVVR